MKKRYNIHKTRTKRQYQRLSKEQELLNIENTTSEILKSVGQLENKFKELLNESRTEKKKDGN